MRGLRRLFAPLSAVAVLAALTACTSSSFNRTGGEVPARAAGQAQPGTQIGSGQIRVALILPLSAPGNAGVAATSMKNAADMALAEFKNPNIQLLVKDDGGNPQTAQADAQQAIAEGAEIIIGPLFAQSVSAVGQVARQRGIPVIAFSTDASVAAPGVYLLSFLPASDVKRIVEYAVSRGKRSFAALLPDNAYGSVVQAAFQQEVPRHGGRILAIEKYPLDPGKIAEPVHKIAQVAGRVDNIFIPDGADAVPQVVARARRRPREPQARAVARHRAVGRSAHLRRPAVGGRLVCRTGVDRLPQFLGPLPPALRPGPGAHGDARL